MNSLFWRLAIIPAFTLWGLVIFLPLMAAVTGSAAMWLATGRSQEQYFEHAVNWLMTPMDFLARKAGLSHE